MNYGRIYAVQYLSPHSPSQRTFIACEVDSPLVLVCINLLCWTALRSTRVNPLMHNNLVGVAGLGRNTSACGSNRLACIAMETHPMHLSA